MNVDENHATRSPDGSPGDTQPQSTQRAATAPLLVSFAAGNIGAWRIDRITPIAGDSLAGAPRLNVIDGGNAVNGLTWFEHPPEASGRFEDLVRTLRATPEWCVVDREVDIRLSLLSPQAFSGPTQQHRTAIVAECNQCPQ
jgi:hypothetical protein